MCADESHKFCNTFSLTMMCRVSKEGDLLDHNEEELTSINNLVEDIAGIATLNEKAKVITIQAYPGIIFSLFIVIDRFRNRNVGVHDTNQHICLALNIHNLLTEKSK